jgi:hypothetical protein
MGKVVATPFPQQKARIIQSSKPAGIDVKTPNSYHCGRRSSPWNFYGYNANRSNANRSNANRYSSYRETPQDE